jgi:hypothetical protein
MKFGKFSLAFVIKCQMTEFSTYEVAQGDFDRSFIIYMLNHYRKCRSETPDRNR